MFLRNGYGERLDATEFMPEAPISEVVAHLPFAHGPAVTATYVRRNGEWTLTENVPANEWVRFEMYVPSTGARFGNIKVLSDATAR